MKLTSSLYQVRPDGGANRSFALTFAAEEIAKVLA